MFDGKLGKAKSLSPMEKKAKLQVLDDLRGDMKSMMKEKLGSGALKKVTVASDSDEGLKEGLEKAEDVLGEQSEEDSIDPEIDESMEDMENCTPEELEEKIAKLQAILKLKK